ncbi:MAG: hypothetical protein QOD86_10 [Miltoncostaeaceae bacterium]|jgi:hypothetical protein|nr:hypothetical protein [Miltoncostaeaceae bacterium]
MNRVKATVALGSLIAVIGVVIAIQGIALGNAIGVILGLLLAGLGGGRAYLARKRS